MEVKKNKRNFLMDDKIKKLIEVLDLKKDHKGLYTILWGKKTEVGLIATIKKVLELNNI